MVHKLMSLGVALTIVHDLAKDNALSEEDAHFNDQSEEYSRQQLALDVVEDFITNVCAEENGEMFICHKCKGMIEEEDVLWVDPETTLATAGDRGKPFHAGCAPEQEIVICVICGGEIEDIDQLHVMASGQFCHKSCIEQ